MTQLLEIDRRSMLGRMLQLTGAVALAGFSSEALAAAVAGGRRYLEPATFTLLSAVADTIVPRTDTPGAMAAQVPAKFDALLANWASGERRFELSQALINIDRQAQAQQRKSFAALNPDQRKTFLTAYDVNALRVVPRTVELTGIAAMLGGPSFADAAYAKLKELIVMLYYISHEALTTELTYEHVPGGWTPSITVTPETRPEGGLGVF